MQVDSQGFLSTSLMQVVSTLPQAENIIQIELDLPNRTTKDYEGPEVAPRVQAALDAALQDEEDITLDAKYACFV